MIDPLSKIPKYQKEIISSALLFKNFTKGGGKDVCIPAYGTKFENKNKKS